MAVRGGEAIYKNNTYYLCTQKHREISHEHSKITGKTQGIKSQPERGHPEIVFPVNLQRKLLNADRLSVRLFSLMLNYAKPQLSTPSCHHTYCHYFFFPYLGK